MYPSITLYVILILLTTSEAVGVNWGIIWYNANIRPVILQNNLAGYIITDKKHTDTKIERLLMAAPRYA